MTHDDSAYSVMPGLARVTEEDAIADAETIARADAPRQRRYLAELEAEMPSSYVTLVRRFLEVESDIRERQEEGSDA